MFHHSGGYSGFLQLGSILVTRDQRMGQHTLQLNGSVSYRRMNTTDRLWLHFDANRHTVRSKNTHCFIRSRETLTERHISIVPVFKLVPSEIDADYIKD